MTYRTIVADPPWDYKRDKGFNGYVGTKWDTKARYTLMTLDEMAALAETVHALADPTGCSMWMWTTNAFLHDAFHLLSAWGFDAYKMTFVWLKHINGIGAGRWARSGVEFVLLATRGKVPPPPPPPNSNVFTGSRAQMHSAKPPAFYDLVERVSEGPYLDMFGGRGTLRFGWDVWGDGK